MLSSFLFLGTGASAGVPVIGCKCAVCHSSSAKNHRLRPSGLLKIGKSLILIDVGPDFRQQALRAGIDRLDAVLLTHTHFDHIAGIDELRVFYLRQNTPLPLLLSKESFEELKIRYYYLMNPIQPSSSLTAQLDPCILPKKRGEIDFARIKIRYFSYFQGEMLVTGYRIGDFAYVSDICTYHETIFEDLSGVKVLVVSALQKEKARWMFTVDEAAEFSRQVGVTSTWLTHVNHDIDDETDSHQLPEGIQFAYDGLEILLA
ncbi:MAG TPA: MBL fold metallo-hydrolase [Chlamydiales bacterium]|nr:MBL fold metallo-hydrolase [Chlamydiales bacterium]